MSFPPDPPVPPELPSPQDLDPPDGAPAAAGQPPSPVGAFGAVAPEGVARTVSDEAANLEAVAPGPVAGEAPGPATLDATAPGPVAGGAPAEANLDPAKPGSEAGPRTRLERFRAWRFAPVVEVIATVALALVLAESVQAAVVKPFVIPSESMEPTLLPGQRVLVNRLAYDFGSTPARGDIVVFHPPSSLVCKANVPLAEPCPLSLRTHASDYFVKRVMGLPGDRLSIRNGHPVINGREITKEPYVTQCLGSSSCNMPHAIVIPRGEYYMLGDNRGDSDDSRYWGPVPLSWIIGEVFATYWPIDRIGVF